MRSLFTNSLRFLQREDGPTAVEYALVLALIVVVCIIAITALGSGVTKPFKKYSKSAAIAIPAASGNEHLIATSCQRRTDRLSS